MTAPNGFVMMFASILLPVVLAACSDSAADPARPDQGLGVQSAAAIIEVAPAEAHIAAAGQSVALEVALRDSRGRVVTGKLVNWKSMQPTVARVDGSGRVTGLAKGTALVLASVDGVADTARVMVDAGPADAVSLTVLPQVAAIANVGSTFDFAVELLDADGDPAPGGDVTWESLDAGLATVSSSGRVFALAEGTARIVARSGVLADTAQVQIGSVQQAASIAIVPELTSLDGPGSTAPLSILLKDAAGGMLPVSNITWSSNAPGIVRVSSAGVVTGVSVGIAQITAKHGALEAYAAVEVGGESQPARVVILSDADTINTIGATVDLAATVLDAAGNEVLSAGLSWSSLDPAAAIVGPGRVAGVSKGIARIVARHGALADTAVVWVTPAPPSAQAALLDVVPENDTIPSLGATLQLTATVSDAQGQPIAGKAIGWQSLDAGVASVNSEGVVTAVAKGSARIVASHLSLSDTAVLHVAPAPDPVEGGGSEDELPPTVTIYPGVDTIPNIGGTLLFEAVIVDGAGKVVPNAEAVWSTMDGGILTLEGSGSRRTTNARAIQQGSARIVATFEGVADTALVAVAPGAVLATPAGVRVTPAADTIAVLGGSVQLTGNVVDGQGRILLGHAVKWSTLDPGVAVVSGGVVTGLSSGTARIRVSFGAFADTAVITVASALSVQPAFITLTASSATLTAGGTVQLTATVRDAQNKIMPGAPLTWLSQDPAIAGVSGSGIVNGVAAGATQIIVSTGALADTAAITVNPPKSGGSVVVPPTQLSALVEEVIGPVGLPPGAQFDSLRTLAETWSEHHWTSWSRNHAYAAINTINYYDFAALMYYLGALTGDAKWAARADSLAKSYCAYACKPNTMVQPHQWQPRGMEIYYRRTGDPAARAALDLYGWKLARQLDGTATYGYFIGGPSPNMDNRQVGRSILSTLAAVHSVGRTDLRSKLDLALTNLDAQQKRDGGARWSYLGAKDPVFLAAILVHALGDMERRGVTDPRIAAMSDRWLDDAWKDARPTRNCQGQVRTTLPYYYGGVPACYLHTLNGIFAVPFAQRYARTGNAAHLNQVMQLIDGALASETWDAKGKQFMEVARTLWAAGIVARAQGY